MVVPGKASTAMSTTFTGTLFNSRFLELMFTGAAVIASLLVIGLSLCWVARDAERRRKDGMVVATIVFFCGYPLSLLIWMAFRPDVADQKKRN